MRTKIAVAVLGCLALASCGGSASTTGTWVLDVDATLGDATKKIDEQLAKMPEEGRKMAEPMMKAGLAMIKNIKFEIEMKSDGTATFEMSGMGDSSKATGTWEEKGGKITLRAKTVDGKPAEGDDKKEMVLTREGDKLVAEMGDGANKGKLVLKKK